MKVLWTLLWIVAMASGSLSQEVGENLRYDIKALKRVDPKWMMGRELDSIAADVRRPRAIAVDAADRIYVGGEREIAILDAAGRSVRRYHVDQPVQCLAVDPAGVLFVGHEDRISVRGTNDAAVAGWTVPGSNAVLTSLAVVGSDVFAADAGQRVVWRFDRDGRLLNRIGAKDPARGWSGFFIPSPYFDLGVGPGGALWVVDPGRHKFIQFAPNGDAMSSWERAGMDIEGFSGCCNPSHFAIRADGSFVTSEKGLVRVKVHAATGALLGVLAAPSRFEDDTRGIDLAVDGKGRVLALVPEKARILVFTLEEKK